MHRLASSWAPVLLIAGGIFALSAQPGDLQARWLPFAQADKLAHALIFGLLGLALFRALARSFPRLGFPLLSLLTVLAATLYGVSDELHQRFVPGRTPEVLDVVADAAGALLACVAVYLHRRGLAKGGRA